MPKLLQIFVPLLLLSLCRQAASAQVRIEGTVYDRSQRFPMQGVSVIGTSGVGTMTDSAGHYSIRLRPADSIYFSYLGKVSGKVPVKNIDNSAPFDMSLDAPVDTLSTVFVGQRSYHQDSLENRREYAKLFNYDPTGFIADKKPVGNPTFGIGLDIGMLWDAKRNKRMDNFRQFLEQQEHEKYIDHRFTKAIARKLTGLQSPVLDTFMRMYRPSYEFVVACQTDMELYQYIKDSGRYFKDMWKQEHPDADTSATPAVTTP